MREQCQYRIFRGGRGAMGGHLCSRLPKDGGRFCSIHTPEAREQRRDERDARWKAERDVQRQQDARENQDKLKAEMFDGLLAILEESQTFIGGDWRERRDAAIKHARVALK